LGQTACDGFEAGGKDEDVEFMKAGLGMDAFGGNFDDGVFFEVYEVDIGSVVDFVVTLFETWSFGAKRVRSYAWCFS